MEYLPGFGRLTTGGQTISDPLESSISSPFSCYLIGRDSFLIPCSEVLLAANCQILGIISTGKSIEAWTAARSIPFIPTTVDLYECLSQQPFDYLFSISNSIILSPTIIDLPRRGAINCHDAMLPKYGGLNAPAWAIFYRESMHGVTWHQITPTIDGGDILQQSSVPIANDETTFTLSVKCYQEILTLFERLVAEIISDSVTLTKQNLNERSYFGRSHKPSPGCIIDWQLSAEHIEAMVRSLTFGDYENSIGLPKIAIGNELIIVTKTAIVEHKSRSAPGTICEIEGDRLTIATSSFDLSLLAVRAIDGESLTIAELVTKFQLQVGDILTTFDPDLTNKISQFEAGLVKHEQFWVDRLSRLNPLPVPFAQTTNSSIVAERERQEWLLPNRLTDLGADRDLNCRLAAILAFLARISRQESFEIGLRCERLESQLAGLPDLFSHTIPWRIEIDGDLGFTKTCSEIDRQIQQIASRQTYARDLVLRYPELQALAKLGANERLPIEIVIVPDLNSYRSTSTASLTWIIAERGDLIGCNYDPNTIDRHGVTAMLQQLDVFMDRIIADPERSIGSLSLVSDRDLERMLVDWNATTADYPTDKCIHQLFEARAALQPQAIAVRHEDSRSVREASACAEGLRQRQLTYGELNERANRLAHYLQSLGVKPDVLVGISVERSIDMAIGILGILKAGGAYVPLDPTYPQERLAFMVADTAISVLLTQSKLIDRLPAHQARIVCLDRDLPADLPRENLTTTVTPNNLAYAIYTSGSTGTPKGVLIEHHSLVNYATATTQEFAVTPADRILQFTSLNFDISVEEIFTCWVAGATLVLRTEATLEIDTFLQQCRDWQISVVSLPTAYWHELTIRLEADPTLLPPTLRLVVIGGEQIATERFRAWQRTIGAMAASVRLINTYGPTETTVSALWADLSAIDANTDRLTIPIGRPLPNVRVYVLDPDLQPVPIGMPGELYIGGVGLARGYHNRLEQNTTRFLHTSWRSGTNERLYRTGDLVCYRSRSVSGGAADGNIDFLGRIDRQVKIRGFRIELGEVEAILDRHPDLAQTVVMAREDNPGNKRLVAYCVAKSGLQPNISDLRNFIAEQVPNYLVPAMFVLLAELPLSPNGKVDLRALPTPEDTRQASATAFVAPQTEIEIELAQIWERILGLKSIGINDNFFELGGHSLLALQLFNEIEKIWGEKLPLATLFQNDTIEKLADLLRQNSKQIFWSSLVQIRSGQTNKSPLFCIHSVGGNILEYYPLANYLGNERTIYGLQSRGLDGKQSPLDRIEEMASQYIQEMLAVQPDGAYFLIGYSLGGTIALEIAQQLRAQGKQVAFLGLLDCSSPNLEMSRPSIIKSIPIHLQNLWQLQPNKRLKYIVDRIKYQFNKVDYRDFLLSGVSEFNQITPEILNVIDTNIQAEREYIARPYLGEVSLFRCQIQLVEQSPYPDLGWSNLVGDRLKIYPIASSHYEILREPSVQLTAETLKQCLDEIYFTSNCYFFGNVEATDR